MSSKRLPADLSAWPKNPWTVLGVAAGVDRAGLRRAYAALLREFNPEHFPDHFCRIRESYEVVLQQVEWNEARKSEQQAEPTDFRPPPASDREAGAAPVEADRPPPPERAGAGDSSTPDVSPARWHDELDDLWNRAVGRDMAAYRALVDMEARFSGRRDLCLRLYWLLVAWPELDERREACDWLARGMRLSGLRGPLAELYRRELEDRPDEVFQERCGNLLQCEADPAQLADLAEWRWRAAVRFENYELIAGDLEILRPRLAPASDGSWGRLLLTAIDEMCWSRSAEDQSRADAIWKEIDDSPHLHTQLNHSMDRTETMRSVARGWNLLYSVRDVPSDLLDLTRLSLQRPTEQIVPRALALLNRLLIDGRPVVLLDLFDRIWVHSPAVLGQMGQLIAMCGNPEPTQRRPDEDEILALARLHMQLQYRDIRDIYVALRPHVLEFCVRERVSPETLVRMPDSALVETPSVNADLIQRMAADVPLRLAYLAHRATGI